MEHSRPETGGCYLRGQLTPPVPQGVPQAPLVWCCHYRLSLGPLRRLIQGRPCVDSPTKIPVPLLNGSLDRSTISEQSWRTAFPEFGSCSGKVLTFAKPCCFSVGLVRRRAVPLWEVPWGSRNAACLVQKLANGSGWSACDRNTAQTQRLLTSEILFFRVWGPSEN